jgi:hypothetical protein
VLALCSFSSASATTLTFDQTGVYGGTLSFNPVTGILTGTDILFGSVTGSGTTANDGASFAITDGKLNFTTAPGTYTSPDSWAFGPGGSFILTGTVTDGSTTATGNLLNGTFAGAPSLNLTAVGDMFIFTGAGTDTKNTDLLDIYGIDNALADYFIYSTLNVTATSVSYNETTGAFTAAPVTNADVTNSVPDASIMLLLGPSLLCLGMIGRRRKFKSES